MNASFHPASNPDGVRVGGPRLEQKAAGLTTITRGVSRFQCDVFPQQEALYSRLATNGQQPKALMIS